MQTVTTLPTAPEFQAALQNPRLKFNDPRLKICEVESDQNGLPIPRSGGFAITYHLLSTNKQWAVRCFHKFEPERESRYQAIISYLEKNKSTIFTTVEYLDSEILIGGKRYPITIMDWIDGETLKNYIYVNSSDKSTINKLPDEFLRVVSELERLKIAHGDLSDLNIIVKNSKMVLVDYDGMYVPPLAGRNSIEIGNINYQHPKRSKYQYNEKLDRFSEIVIYLALSGIKSNPTLFLKYRTGVEGLLFCVNDFTNPYGSALLRELESIPNLQSTVQKFRSICLTDFENIPRLKDLLENQPLSIPESLTTSLEPITPANLVYDATDISQLLEKEGEYVTIVGKITDIKVGVGRNNRPYAFFNFGDYRLGSFTVVFWSKALEILEKLGKNPNDFHLEWVSVTGVITNYDNGRVVRPQIVLDSPADLIIIPRQLADLQLHPTVSQNTTTRSKVEKSKLEQKLPSSMEHKKSLEAEGIFEKINQLYSGGSIQKSPNTTIQNPKSPTMPVHPSQPPSKPIQGPQPTRSLEKSISKDLNQLYSQNKSLKSSIPLTISKGTTKSKTKTWKNKIFSDPIIWGCLIVLVLVIILVSLAILLNPSGHTKILPTNTPTITITLTLYKTFTPSQTQIRFTSVPTITTIFDQLNCISWENLTNSDIGLTRCVYGKIIKIYSSGDYLQIIRLSDKAGTFLVWDKNQVFNGISIGDCIAFNGIIKRDATSLFMDIVNTEVFEYGGC